MRLIRLWGKDGKLEVILGFIPIVPPADREPSKPVSALTGIEPKSLATKAQGWERLVYLMLCVAFCLLVAGVLMPMVKVNRFIVMEDYVSIIGGITSLLEDDEYLVAAIIFLFSIIFPALKIFYALKVWITRTTDEERFQKTLRRLDTMGKWSMLDIFVVGLMIFSIKATGVADATSAPGLYLFTGAVALSILSVELIKSAAKRQGVLK